MSEPVEKKVVVNAISKDGEGEISAKAPFVDDYSRLDSDVSDDEADVHANEPSKEPVNEYTADLDYIDLTNDRLEDIGDLTPCTLLEELVVRQNRLSNEKIAQFSFVKTLKRIDLYDNRLTPLTGNPFEGLENLEELDLSFNELRYTRGLEGLPALVSLYLIQNKITKIGDLSHFAKTLKLLELGSNRIRVIENLNPLVNLTELYLGRNKITHITGLDKLVNLRILSFQSNRITQIEGLETLVNLEEFYISHNGLKDLSGFPALPNLKIFDAAGNFVTDITNLSPETHPALEEIWMNNNKITSLEWLKEWNGSSLSTVYLGHNPVARTCQYPDKIREYVPAIVQIDAEMYD